jgi:hypothetical protein
MTTTHLQDDLIQIEAETFEIFDLTGTGQDLADGGLVIGGPAGPVAACNIAASSSSCSCSSTCSSSCSSTSSTSTGTSTSSCG